MAPRDLYHQTADPKRWYPSKDTGLARALQKAGYGSHRQTEEMVKSGRVSVDGVVCQDPTSTVEPTSEITLDKKPLVVAERRYFVFHKPPRVVCTSDEATGRPLVSDFFPKDILGLNAAGRLDGRTSGLLLISNDLTWNNLAVASGCFEQEYRVQIEGELTSPELSILSAGVHLPKVGVFRAQQIKVVEILNKQTVLTVVLSSGEIRSLRRMFETIRHKVLLVRRVRFGEIRLNNLPAGQMRRLSEKEVQYVRDITRAANL